MQGTCAYCGNPFSFQRKTKKYCSDNCKQMAYFTRNGFVPANEFDAKAIPVFPKENTHVPVNVKDVKYTRANTERIADDVAINPHDLEKVMLYAKCLVRNLLQLSQHEYVERDTFLEFTATWSQFTQWGTFQSSVDCFTCYGLIADLNDKLLKLMKAHKDSNFIELILSLEVRLQLEDTLKEMGHLRNIRFSDIRF
jgi:hypothetical protein